MNIAKLVGLIVLVLFYFSSCAFKSVNNYKEELIVNITITPKNCNQENICADVLIMNKGETDVCYLKHEIPISSDHYSAPDNFYLQNIETRGIPARRGFIPYYESSKQRFKAKVRKGWEVLGKGGARSYTYNLDTWYELKNSATYQLDLSFYGYRCNELAKSKDFPYKLRVGKTFKVRNGFVQTDKNNIGHPPQEGGF